MKMTMNKLLARAKHSAAVAAVVATPVVFAAGEIEAGMTELQGTIIGYITLGITTCIAVLLVSLAGDIGISVAKKWLRKGAN